MRAVEPIEVAPPEPPVVMVNGIEFIPKPTLESRPTIAIAITTRNRWDVLGSNLDAFERHTPEDVPIFVVDDVSDTVPEKWNGRFELIHLPENRGIAGAKNKCLELLYATGAEHLFLFDDDAFPNAQDWWLPYVESPEPHLMRIFADLAGTVKLNDIKVIYGDPQHTAYTGPRGFMLYVERRVLEKVGGMDPIYGKWGWEHADWSNRIHNAGLTTWRFADVSNGGDLVFSLDEHERVDRGTVHADRKEMAKRNIEIYRERFHSDEYCEFRDPVNMVLTCLYDTADPQRRGAKPLDISALDTLAKSVKERINVFTNAPSEEKSRDGMREWYSPVGVGNLYIQRWYDYWRWLRAHPEIGFVWCVDGTDVEMLQDPFPSMLHGVLYLGSEPKRVDDPWMQRNQANDMRKLFRDHFYNEVPLLNAGLVGGDRITVMSFIREMLDLFEENQINTFIKKDTDITTGVNDMGILNVVGYRKHWRVVTGPIVHTLFKAEERNSFSWWKHK